MKSVSWEQGSNFHWPQFEPVPSTVPMPWGATHLHLGSGRDALVLILRYGMATRGWRRLWVPGYMCQEVIAAAAQTNIRLSSYTLELGLTQFDSGNVPVDSGDVVMVVNLFGLGCPSAVIPPPGVEIIEDHTHDPFSTWARQSTAEYAFASLRKTLPVPSGAVLWSPVGNHLPDAPPVTEIRERASQLGLGAMHLKSLYLRGHDVDKASFRKLSALSERAIGMGPPSAVPEPDRQMLSLFPIERWRMRRQSNHRQLVDLLGELDGVVVLKQRDDESVPFSAVLITSTQQLREDLLVGLVRQGIYPAVLWSLEEAVVPGQHRKDLDLSRRLLSIHCDWRYTSDDIEQVADAIVAVTQIKRGFSVRR